MGKIFVGQSDLILRLETGVNLTGVSSPQIVYRKPSGTESAWTATITGPGSSILSYDVANTGILDEAGTWTIWASVTFSTGVALGEPVRLDVYAAGT